MVLNPGFPVLNAFVVGIGVIQYYLDVVVYVIIQTCCKILSFASQYMVAVQIQVIETQQQFQVSPFTTAYWLGKFSAMGIVTLAASEKKDAGVQVPAAEMELGNVSRVR